MHSEHEECPPRAATRATLSGRDVTSPAYTSWRRATVPTLPARAPARRVQGTVLAVTAVIYAVVEGVEAVGLWRERRWAEYLTAIATAGEGAIRG